MTQRYKIRGRDGERGSALLAVLMFTLAVGSAIGLSSLNLRSKYKAVRSASVGQNLAASVMGRVRSALGGRGDCLALNSTLRPFRNFASSAPTYALALQGESIVAPCLLSAEESKYVRAFNIHLIEVANDPIEISKKLQLTIKLRVIDPSGQMPPQNVSLSRGFRVKIASLDYFSVIFMGQAFPLLNVSGPKLTVAGAAFYAGNQPPQIENIYRTQGGGSLRFDNPFYVKARSLSTSSSRYQLSEFRKVFNNGIETDSLNSPLLQNFLPDSSPAWKHGFDYSYLNAGSGYALPESKAGQSALSCSAAKAYQSANGLVQSVPSDKGLQQASKSCGKDSILIPTMQFMNRNQDFDLSLKADDAIFCGLIVARRLRIQLKDPGKYALFGQFLVDQIEVSGHHDAELFVYGSQGNETLAVPLPDGRTSFRKQVKSLAASTAYNFFLPIAALSSFKPRAPDGYLTSCGSGGFMRYQSSYRSLDRQPGFAQLLTDAVRPLYIVDDSL